MQIFIEQFKLKKKKKSILLKTCPKQWYVLNMRLFSIPPTLKSGDALR